jgi:hypothetical protein
MRRVLGLDLNGWHDFAARDWSFDNGDAPGLASVEYIDGGITAVVTAFKEHSYVAGPQATLSPIGRGGGWGPVGDPRQRRAISNLLHALLAREVEDDFKLQLQAAVDALSVSAQDVVLTVPDRPEFDDERQQMLLDAVNGPRRSSFRLLWHPVAVVLCALEQGLLQEKREGLRIVCLHHTGDGIERQDLELREIPDRAGVFAPERAACGVVIEQRGGLAKLLEEASRHLARHNPHLDGEHYEPSRLPARMLLEEVAEGEGEVLRLDNGDWVQLRAPATRALSSVAGPLNVGPIDADVVLLTTPIASAWKTPFLESIRSSIGFARLIPMPSTAAAEGALIAGR